jgi:hypothetical protein
MEAMAPDRWSPTKQLTNALSTINGNVRVFVSFVVWNWTKYNGRMN